MSKYDMIIIGAGAAGMMAAIVASGSGKRVALVEKNAQLGRKLLATGNGRCNLTNRFAAVPRYHGSTPEFIESVLSRFDQTAAIKFFNGLGLILKEEDNGRIFPRTNQASSVVEVMRFALEDGGVDILLDAQVKGIERSNSWKVSLSSGKILNAGSLIIATGGRAAHYLGSTGDGLYWAQKLGHTLTPIHAALVPIETAEEWVKDIQGIKVEAAIFATREGREIGKRTGDILFTSYGVSGLAALAISGSISPFLETSRVQLHIDLFPDMPAEKLDSTVLQLFKIARNRTIKDALAGILPDRMIPVLLRNAEISERKRTREISRMERQAIVKSLKDMVLTVSKLRPLKEAQVTAGGIDTREISPETLESRLMKGLYFAGEVIDVNGDSGGFNLQWAWSSGYIAGTAAE